MKTLLRFIGKAALILTIATALLCLAIVLAFFVYKFIDERRNIPRTFGEAFQVTETLASKTMFVDEVYGCTHAIIRFDAQTANTIRDGGVETLLNGAKFWRVEGWRPTPIDFDQKDFWQDPESCLRELPDPLATELNATLSAQGAWVHYSGSGGDGYLRIVDPKRQIAAYFRKGD